MARVIVSLAWSCMLYYLTQITILHFLHWNCPDQHLRIRHDPLQNKTHQCWWICFSFSRCALSRVSHCKHARRLHSSESCFCHSSGLIHRLWLFSYESTPLVKSCDISESLLMRLLKDLFQFLECCLCCFFVCSPYFRLDRFQHFAR